MKLYNEKLIPSPGTHFLCVHVASVIRKVDSAGGVKSWKPVDSGEKKAHSATGACSSTDRVTLLLEVKKGSQQGSQNLDTI